MTSSLSSSVDFTLMTDDLSKYLDDVITFESLGSNIFVSNNKKVNVSSFRGF